ncbi:MAG: hypothetical protein HEEMFOPI_01939 [Holosporales bacterium]
MGTYLVTGIIERVGVSKKSLEQKSLTIEAVEESLNRELNLQFYERKEEDTFVCWVLNPKMLEGNLDEFLRAQYLMYEDEIDDETNQFLELIKNEKDGAKLIERSDSDQGFSNLRMTKYLSNYIDVNDEKGFSKNIEAHYYMMSYFTDGKIFMECYKNILNYFERNIRLQKEKYPIAECVKVLITS